MKIVSLFFFFISTIFTNMYGQTENRNTIDWANLHWPQSGTIYLGSSYNVYARVYESGVTDGAGQGSGITAWIGYSTSNSNPSGVGWTWVSASYNTDSGNNDEYVLDLGSNISSVGTYYYTSRFSMDGGSSFVYGGYNAGGGGFWDGSSNVSGTLTIPGIVTTSRQTYTTISIDGWNDFSTSTERFTSTSGTDIYGYITWDADYLYIGYSGSSNSGAITDNGRVYHIYIDSDPNSTANLGPGTTDGEAWRTDPTLPFTANYHYTFKTSDNSETKRIYSDGSWSNDSFTTSSNKGSSYWESRIQRSSIGSPSQIYILMYIEEDWVGGELCGGIPNDIFTDNTTQGSQTFASDKWLGFNLTSSISPNDNANFDQSLPVDLTFFRANPTMDGNIVLEWETASEIDNLGFILERRMNVEYWSEIANYITHPELHGQGSVSYTTKYHFIDETTLGGNHYDYRLADVDIFGSKTYHELEILGIDPLANILDGFHINSIYPNPFNLELTIQFSMSEDRFLNIQVYDIQGRLVDTLAKEVFPMGIHSIKWNGSMTNNKTVSNGIYFMQFQTKKNIAQQKVILLK